MMSYLAVQSLNVELNFSLSDFSVTLMVRVIVTHLKTHMLSHVYSQNGFCSLLLGVYVWTVQNDVCAEFDTSILFLHSSAFL